ncbi:hypothetical protein M0802_008188 [Mischocyttarus mexicanus]|nr:hypothetical protein M0802_008188 [Mischocyttarus mexicanus]
MDIFENRFYKLNYRLLSLVGLWPYEKSRLLRICIINIPVFFFNLTQFLKVCTSEGNFDILKEVLPILMASLAAAIKYYFFDLGIFDIKLLMDNMIKDWDTWKSKEEIKIMEKFAHLGRMYTLGYTVATDTQLMVFCCHVSGVFAIIGFRLENFLEKDMTLHRLTDFQRKECYRHVSLSIKGHKRALEFVKRMESSFSYSLLLQCGLNIICMSMCLYQIVVLYGQSIEIVKFVAFVIGELFHLFVASLSGQTIIDYSSEVYFKAYSGLWYEAPIEVRKLLILIMKRSLEPSRLTAGKIFTYCLDGFSTVR